MELPLVLLLRGSRLVLTIPAWYRALMGGILCLVLGSLLIEPLMPGPLGWAFIILAAFAALYEERWTFDTEGQEIRHRFGLLVLARTVRAPLGEVEDFRLVPWVRGTLPGSAEERAENAGALAESRGLVDSAELKGARRPLHRKPYLSLVFEHEGNQWLVNMVPSRKGGRLRAVAQRLAEHCGKPLKEG